MVVISTAVRGRPSMAHVMAPRPMPAPATMGSPGKCDRATPPAAPMNMPGKVGPPRNPLIEAPYANPLQATRSKPPPTENEAVFVSSEGRADWPENNTSDDDFPLPSAKATARPPYCEPDDGGPQQDWTFHVRLQVQGEPPNDPTHRTAATPMPIAQPNSAPSGWEKGGRLGTASEKVP